MTQKPQTNNDTPPSYRGQRLLDLAVAVPLLAIASVPTLFAIAAVSVTMGRPVLFKQQRVGLHGEEFTIYKIRSMTNQRNADGELLPAQERMTRFGTWMRRHALDELPQLWNVVKGDMAMVGPRPMPQETGANVQKFHLRNQVRPGLTGLAKIREQATTHVTLSETLSNDLEYIARRGLVLDATILFRTAAIAFGGRNNPLWEPDRDRKVHAASTQRLKS